MIEAAIANLLPRLSVPDCRRWQALHGAIGRMHNMNIEQGVSSKSVRLRVEALQDAESEMNVDEGDAAGHSREVSPSEESGGSKVVLPIRQSSRRSVKAEKVHAMDEDNESDDGEDDEGEEDEEDDGKGLDKEQEPQEKKNKAYMPYNSLRHFYWVKTMRILSSPFSSPSNLSA